MCIYGSSSLIALGCSILFCTPAIPRKIGFVCWRWAFQVPCGTGRALDAGPFASLALPLWALWVLLYGFVLRSVQGLPWCVLLAGPLPHTTSRIYPLAPGPSLKEVQDHTVWVPKSAHLAAGGQICIFCSFCCGRPSITKLQSPGKLFFGVPLLQFPGKFNI